jgi:hypothetical protein
MSAVVFSRAVEAIASGDESGLRALLETYPGLVRERSTLPHQVTLLGGRRRSRCGGAGLRYFRHYAVLDGYERSSIPGGCAGEPDRRAGRSWRQDRRGGRRRRAAGIWRCCLDIKEAAERLVLRCARADDRAGRFSFPVARDADAREVALIVAAMHGQLAVVRALLDGGVDANATPYCRQRALHYATYMGRAEVVEELLARGADASLADTQMHRTPAQWARELGNSAIAERLERR